MSDFYDQKEEKPMEEQLPEKIKVGEKEYTQDELNQLVGLGESSRELETKWNTKIDSLMPAYTKTTQELAELRKKENDWLKTQAEPKKTETPEEKSALQEEQAKQLLKEKFGVVTKDDFEKDFRNRYMIERQAEKLNDSLNDLATEIDGTDGRPKFNAQEILNYMGQTNIPNPQTAYKIKYEKELDSWKEKQIQSVKKPGLLTLDASSAGSKSPAPVKITKENLTQVLAEAMGN